MIKIIKKETYQTLKNNNKFLTKVNTDLRKDNESYQITNKELGNQCFMLGEEISKLKKEIKNLKRKNTMLQKEINNGSN